MFLSLATRIFSALIGARESETAMGADGQPNIYREGDRALQEASNLLRNITLNL